jgi:hypothetical protein
MNRLTLPLAGGFVLWAATPVSSSSGSVADDLVLAVARTAANEAFGSPGDVALIAQVTRSHGRSRATRLRWLRRHSPCATGVLSQQEAEQRPGNCRWSRNLDRSLKRPLGWPTGLSWTRYRRVWQRTLTLSRQCVRGRCRSPCEGRPWTWGGAMDDAGARARGLVPLVCTETLNGGYGRPPR